MPPKKRSQRRSRGGPRTTAVTSPAETLNRQLAVRTDVNSQRGKYLLQLSSAPTTVGVIPINPGSGAFGNRQLALQAQYSRFRVVKLTFFCSTVLNATETPVPAAFGLLDDVPGSSSTPTTVNDIVSLRCSTFTELGRQETAMLEWKPLDPAKWYYTTSESTTQDARLELPATVFCIALSGGTVNHRILVYYTIEYSGAQEGPGGP